MTFREEINRVIGIELRKGAPALGIAMALTTHVNETLAIASVGYDIDRQQLLRRIRSATKKRTGKRSHKAKA